MGILKKNILVTGGAKGLGKYLGKFLTEHGHRVYILDHNDKKDLSENYGNVIAGYYGVDLSDWVSVDGAVSSIISTHGTIDVLINNGALRVFKNCSDFDITDIEKCIMVNFQVPVLLTRRLLPIMKRNMYGRIINISSKAAYFGYSSGSMYCSTKSALNVFTECVSKELDVHIDNVTINAICPDSFRTKEGENLQGCDNIMGRIAMIIDDIIGSDRNGEIIPVLYKRTKITEGLRRFKGAVLWFIEY